MTYVATNAWTMALPMVLAFGGWVWVMLDASQAARRRQATRSSRGVRIIALAGATTGVWLALGLVEDIVRTRIARAARVPTGAMAPTILPGDYVFLTPVTAFRLARDNVVMWQASDGREYIHRVVGLPGDTLAMQDSVLYRNRRAVTEPYARYERVDSTGGVDSPWGRRRWGPLVVPEDSVFVLGDNRDNSADSRYRGFVPVDRVVSRPRRIYFSRDPETGTIRWHRIGVEPGKLGAPPA